MNLPPLDALVSIGIPTFNRADCLRRILQVATAQTYPNLEIIVSDNASTDGVTPLIVQEFQARDSRIRYIRQEKNVGVIENAAHVLEQANGHYFTWFSDDDWRSPEFIELLLAELERQPTAQFAFCDYHEVDESGTMVPGYPGSHLGVFRPFTSHSKTLRTLSYFWEESSRGKQNLFYALFRTDFLRSFDLRELSAGHSRLNMDNLLIYSALQKSLVALRPEAMCTLTCGNPKYYLAAPSQSLYSRLMGLVRTVLDSGQERLSYIRLTSSPWVRAALWLAWLPGLAKSLLVTSGKVLERRLKRGAASFEQGSPSKLQLPNVTLIAVATKEVEETLLALKYSCRGVHFGAVKLLSHYTPAGMPKDFQFSRIPKMGSIDDWSKFVVYDLGKYVDTDYALLVHCDGFVVNPESWRPEFFDYDYIGSPWPLPTDDFSYRDIHGKIVRVGNSVSLRSKRLLDLPSKIDMPWQPFHGFFNEDGFICVNNRHIFESHGMKIAPLEVAKYFGHENMIPEVRNIKPFVFHKWSGSNRKYPDFRPLFKDRRWR